jgi:chorismate synthase
LERTVLSSAEPEYTVDMVADGTMYRVAVEEDGIMCATYVSSMHLVEEKVPYLRQKVRDIAREAFLKDREDV